MRSRALRVGLVAFALSIGVLVTHGPAALAVPALQLYIEGATYNPTATDPGFNPDVTPETWYVTANTFTLWVLGNVGQVGAISNLKLAAAYDYLDSPSFSFTSTTADPSFFLPAFSGVPDPSVPSAVDTASPVQSGTGGTPTMGDGSPLPPHGVYDSTTAWKVFSIGNFTLTDSPIGDFIDGECPGTSCTFPSTGQINAYDVSIGGDLSHGGWVVFDAFDTIVIGRNHVQAKFAPFSHNAQANGSPPPVRAPEPSTLLLLGAGLTVLGGAAWSRRRDT